MKKFLSLVLALVMTMSLVTISAGAKDFTDSSSIKYGEAVDVMSGVGVIDGYTTGDFKPTDTLTRGAAAKIICNMILGPTTAGALSADTAPFKDVPANHVFAGYIAYCAQQGIINGYNDGSFKPAGTVTGYQFLKMLLGALGYDGSIEGFTGSNWSVQVAKLAVSLGLDDGNDNFVGTKAMTREEACLYAYNAMMSTMVEYDSTTNIVIGGTAVTVGGSKAQLVYSTTSAARNFNNDADHHSSTGGYTLEFAEKYFPNLTETVKYAEGRVGHTLKYKGQVVSDFGTTDEVLATSASGDALSKLTTKSDSKYIGYDADTTVTYLLNDDTSSLSAVSTAVAKKGVVVNFLDTDGNGKYNVVSAVEKRVAQVGGDVRTTTSGSVTKVTIPGVVSSKDTNDVVYPSNLAKDDIVLYYNSANGTTYVEKAESVTGTMIANSTDKVTVDGTTYAVSGLTGAKSHTNIVTDTKAKANTTFYLDNGGNICYYVLANNAVSLENTLFVREATYAGYVVNAKVVFMDGSTATITVDKTATYNGSLKDVLSTGAVVTSGMADGKVQTNTFYTYTKNDNGSYSLTACQYQGVTSPATDNGTAAVVTKGTAQITLATPSTSVYANANTAYVLEKGSVSGGAFTAGTSYSVYTGVSNTAGYKDAVTSDTKQAIVYALYDSSNVAIAVVARDGILDTTSASDYDVVLPVSGPVTVYKTDGAVDYYAYGAVVNGAYVESYKVANNSLLTLGTPVLVNSYDGEKANGVEGTPVAMSPTSIGTGTEVTVTSGTLTVKNVSGTVQGAVALAGDAKMVIYDVANKTAEIVDPMNLYAADGHYYTVTSVATSNTNSAVKYVFVNDYAVAAATISTTSVEAKLAGSSGTPVAVTPTFTVTLATGYTATVTSNATGTATVSPASISTTGSPQTVTVTGAAVGTTTVDIAVTHTASGIVTHYTVNVSVVAQ